MIQVTGTERCEVPTASGFYFALCSLHSSSRPLTQWSTCASKVHADEANARARSQVTMGASRPAGYACMHCGVYSLVGEGQLVFREKLPHCVCASRKMETFLSCITLWISSRGEQFRGVALRDAPCSRPVLIKIRIGTERDQ